MDALYDRFGRDIKVGDTIKVFHFFGARRKRHYMFKYVAELVQLGEGKKNFFKVAHLNREGGHYHEHIDGRQLRTHEIVQGYGEDGTAFYDRPKHYPTMPEFPWTPADRPE